MSHEDKLGVKILGLGKAVPKRALTNEELSQVTDTSDEWIVTRTGIRQRRMTNAGLPERFRDPDGAFESDSTLAQEAAERALEDAKIDKSQIGLLITATTSPDTTVPSVSCLVQERMGLPSGMIAFDLNAACSGFVYALEVACALMKDLHIEYALVVGAEELSRILDFDDRSTAVLFGDGAGAAVITLSKDCRSCFTLGAAGDGKAIAAPYGGSVTMEGRKVFRFAVTTIPKILTELEEMSAVSMEEVDYIVCHQANERIIEHVREKLGLPYEKFFRNLQNYGNTSAASIPLALAEMKEGGLITAGTRLFCAGFGAGLTWGGAYLEF